MRMQHISNTYCTTTVLFKAILFKHPIDRGQNPSRLRRRPTIRTYVRRRRIITTDALIPTGESTRTARRLRRAEVSSATCWEVFRCRSCLSCPSCRCLSSGRVTIPRTMTERTLRARTRGTASRVKPSRSHSAGSPHQTHSNLR